MRTAAICPTCVTYTNAVCVIYDGPYLSNLGISPTSSLDNALQQINSVAGTFEKTANKSTNISLGTSDVLYPTQKAVKTYVDNKVSGHSGNITVGSQTLTFTNGLLTSVV
jgi:hypothetical protein